MHVLTLLPCTLAQLRVAACKNLCGSLQAEPAIQHFWDVWKLYGIDVRHWDFSSIYFPAILPQATKLLALFFTVAFGSSMDVAAIQQDMPGEQLNYNRELTTVGTGRTLLYNRHWLKSASLQAFHHSQMFHHIAHVRPRS